ncbi:glutathione peroxidase [[Eubacterium] yurii]|nr:glutathione peroxidase [[Eubacterium] yurii]
MGLYEYSIKDGKGNDVQLSEYKGKVILIVNSATTCGFTPQYNELQEMYGKYNSQGFEIIDIPCNQFGGQAPGTDEEIAGFCSLKFGTTFPQMQKSDVNGENELPLYGFLKSQKGFEGLGKGAKAIALTAFLKTKYPNFKTSPDIKWNFTKFLIDREGNVIQRFEPTTDMKLIDEEIQKLL